MTIQGKNARLSRRDFLRLATAGVVGFGATISFAPKGYAVQPDILYQGEVFDARGATLRVAEWGGFWEDVMRERALNQFEKDFNCRIQYDAGWPWFPKFVAGGVNRPPFDITNWNMPEMFKTAGVMRGLLAPQDQMTANVPNTAELWDFAKVTGVGITKLFSQYGFVYRTDMIDEPFPSKFEDFWQDRFADRRGTYITSNTLQHVLFMTAAATFGSGPTDLEAGIQAMRDAMPLKISDFTGNMQILVERGEVVIANQHDGEGLLQKSKGLPVDWFYWDFKPILSQTTTISQNIPTTQKRLAYALANIFAGARYQTEAGGDVFLRPTNKNAQVKPELAELGVRNTAKGLEGLWIPPWDWWNANEQEIVRRVNDIYAGGSGR